MFTVSSSFFGKESLKRLFSAIPDVFSTIFYDFSTALSSFIQSFVLIIVTRNGKIVRKHGPNGPFYTLMLRTRLY